MDMGMDTMQSRKCLLLVPLAWCLSAPALADLTIKPTLSSAIYAYGIKDQGLDADRGMAYEVRPSIDLDLTGSWLSTRLNLQSQNLVFDDSQRDNDSNFSYDWSSTARLLQDQLTISVGLNQQNRRVSESTSRFQDAISSSGDLATVQGQNATLAYANKQFEWAEIDFGLSAANAEADDYIADYQQAVGTSTELKNSVYAMSFLLATKDRNRKFFWGLDADATKTERQVLESQYNRRLNAVFGMPFFWRVSMIATGAVESNSELEGARSVFSQYGSYHSLGGGFEWKITDRSWWNITFNKVTDAEDSREYIGTEFQFTPSRRTTLSGSLDRRFFGRTARVDGSYKLKNLRMSVKVSDTVGSVLGLNGDNLESQLFVCPPGVTPGIDSCFQPPTSSYIPAPGESFYNVTDLSSDLSEFLVVRRNVSYQLGYDFNRLKLAMEIGQRKDQLIERNAVNDNRYVNTAANWQLNRTNNMILALSYSDLIYVIDGQRQSSDLAGAMKSVTLTLKREINRDLSANLNLKRLTVDYRSEVPDYQENRIWLGIDYKF
jgi:uncharacterized protein (PEP-CTERM system associated)